MKKLVLVSSFGILSSVVIYSCGGGGSGSSSTTGGTTTGGTTTVTINPVATSQEVLNNASSVAGNFSSIANTISSLVGTMQGNVRIKTNSVDRSGKLNLISLFTNNFRNHIGKLKSQGSKSDTKNCDGGGSFSYKYTWTNSACTSGYEEACFKNNTINFEETYNNCKYGDSTSGYTTISGYRKGQFVFDANGNVSSYIEIPNQLKFVYPDGSTNYFSNNYRQEYRYVERDGRYEVMATFKSGTISNNNLQVNFSNLSYVEVGENLDPYGDPLKSTLTFNGGITGKINGKEFSYDSKDLRFLYENTTTGEYLSVDGYFYEGLCNKKWYQYKTDTPIFTSIHAPCPTAGKLTINNSYSININSNGKIQIVNSTGKVEKEYASCRDFDNEAKSLVCR